jgi:hypothetical protein
MLAKQKATNDQIITEYLKCKNIWVVAANFGMCGQSVHKRLKRLGIELCDNSYSEDEKKKIHQLYTEGFKKGDGKLKLICAEMSRPVPNVCRYAKQMGWTNVYRKMSSDACLAQGVRASEWIKKKGHPRGSLGMKHSDETKKTISKKSSDAWSKMTEDQISDRSLKIIKTRYLRYGTSTGNRVHGSWRQSWRTIGGKRIFARSSWEANYARYLDFLKTSGNIAEWEHEPQTFWFENIKRGTRSYLPDFRVTNNNGSIEYHEVKGWMDDKSKTKLKRMGIYYPEIKMVLIDSKWFKNDAKKISGMIPEWECSKK